MKQLGLQITVRKISMGAIILLMICILIAVFALVPIPGGDDWETFQGASQRILKGLPLYGEKITHGYYSNPPWVALFFIPLSFLPSRWGWATIAVLSAFILFILCRHWRFGRIKIILTLLSPAAFYIFLHGEIDAFVLGGVLLPYEAWYLVAITKPQVAVGLLLGVRKEKIIRAIFATLIIFLLTIFIFGFWPLKILQQETPFLGTAQNLWIGLWPFQVPAGVALLLLGVKRKNEKLLIAASPFLSPYATTSSLLGPWFALTNFLENWEVALVFFVWWGAVLYRLLGYG
jgi:hypothetical protein